jgi:hypothetical protein
VNAFKISSCGDEHRSVSPGHLIVVIEPENLVPTLSPPQDHKTTNYVRMENLSIGARQQQLPTPKRLYGLWSEHIGSKCE